MRKHVAGVCGVPALKDVREDVMAIVFTKSIEESRTKAKIYTNEGQVASVFFFQKRKKWHSQKNIP